MTFWLFGDSPLKNHMHKDDPAWPLDTSTIRQSLRQHFDPIIFARGQEYLKEKRVINFSIGLPDDHGQQTISAQVLGSEDYEVSIEYDLSTGEFQNFICNCPYVNTDNCKHQAAVGLAYTARQQADENFLKKTRPLPLSTPQTNKEHRGKKISPNLKDYYLIINIGQNCALEIHHKSNKYSIVDTQALLKHPEILSPAQIKTLKWAARDQWRNYSIRAKIKNYGDFFTTLKKSGFAVYKNWEGMGNLLQIDLSPPPLTARLKRVSEYNKYYNYTHNTFHWSLPASKYDRYDVDIFTDRNHIIILEKNKVKVYQSSPILSRLTSRIEPTEDRHRYDNRRVKYNIGTEFTTTLRDEDIIQLNAVITEGKKYLGLETALEPNLEIIEQGENKPKILVDYSIAEETLKIVAIIDYGCYRQDVAQTVYARKINGELSFNNRYNFHHPGTHIMTYEKNSINYARKNLDGELELFQNFYDDTGSGFTKNLKSIRLGHKQIFKFYETGWPHLKQRCQKFGYEIIMARDNFDFECSDFRADIRADLNTTQDLLAFDIDCYCGPDKITIADLRQFIAKGDKVLRGQNGKMFYVSNRAELERFVLMLESFSERENNHFEGKSYHAPELEYIFTSSPHYSGKFAKGYRQFLAEAQSGKSVTPVSLPTRFAKILRPYQKDGLAWLYFLRKYHFAGILADDMGLGKTIQTLVLLALNKTKNKPTIVICPKTLLYNWQSECARFTPKLKVAVIDGTPAERAAIIKKAKCYDLIITGYATLQKDAALYEKAQMVFNYAILDEAQFVKNHHTKNAQIVKKINANYRLALTGTPLENNVSEIWSIFDFLMPGFLGKYASFARRFHKPIMKENNQQALADLRKKIECFMLRRTKTEVLKELPPKIEQISHCKLESAQNILYQEVLSKVKNEIFDTVAAKGFEKSRIHILAALMKLRQICNHPALLLADKNYPKYESAKLTMFKELVEEINANHRKVLVFSQFTAMLDILAAELNKSKISYLYLSGKTKNRQELVAKFNTDPSIPVFLISLKAGGTGLNLTAADNVIIFDPWWNPSVENQAADRAHRIGQTNSVNVFRFITTGTIEEKIMALQNKKRQLFAGLVGESRDIFQKLTWEDIKMLFA